MRKISRRGWLLTLCLLVLAMIGLSLYCLPYSHVAWYDETFMADYTHNLITTGHIYNTMDPKTVTGCLYGPVYFLLTGITTSIGGFGIFTFRLVSTMFYFLCGWMMYKIYSEFSQENTKTTLSVGMVCALTLTFLMDVMNVRSSYSGRMEMVAMFFVLVAYWRYLKYQKCRKPLESIWISLSLTLSVMTTPRVMFVALPLALYQLYVLLRERKYRTIVVYALTPILLYGTWLTWQYGSVAEFFFRIFGGKTKVSSSNSGLTVYDFIGGNYIIRGYHYPLLIATLLSAGYMLWARKIKAVLLYLLPAVSYYLFVFDTGYYSAFMVPFAFMTIAVTLTHTANTSKGRVVGKVLVAAMLLFNFVSYTVIYATTLATKNKRDVYHYGTWVKQRIPTGSKVIGFYHSYYAVVDAGCDFKRITREEVPKDSLEKDFHENYRPDYIISRNIIKKETTMLGYNVKPVATYYPEEDDNFLYRFFEGNKQTIFAKTYISTILKVVDNE